MISQKLVCQGLGGKSWKPPRTSSLFWFRSLIFLWKSECLIKKPSYIRPENHQTARSSYVFVDSHRETKTLIWQMSPGIHFLYRNHMFGICVYALSDRDAETSRHRDTETPRRRDTETPRHRDTETPRRRDTETPRHRDAETPIHRDAETPRHRDAETQGHRILTKHRQANAYLLKESLKNKQCARTSCLQ